MLGLPDSQQTRISSDKQLQQLLSGKPADKKQPVIIDPKSDSRVIRLIDYISPPNIPKRCCEIDFKGVQVRSERGVLEVFGLLSPQKCNEIIFKNLDFQKMEKTQKVWTAIFNKLRDQSLKTTIIISKYELDEEGNWIAPPQARFWQTHYPKLVLAPDISEEEEKAFEESKGDLVFEFGASFPYFLQACFDVSTGKTLNKIVREALNIRSEQPQKKLFSKKHFKIRREGASEAVAVIRALQDSKIALAIHLFENNPPSDRLPTLDAENQLTAHSTRIHSTDPTKSDLPRLYLLQTTGETYHILTPKRSLPFNPLKHSLIPTSIPKSPEEPQNPPRQPLEQAVNEALGELEQPRKKIKHRPEGSY